MEDHPTMPNKNKSAIESANIRFWTFLLRSYERAYDAVVDFADKVKK